MMAESQSKSGFLFAPKPEKFDPALVSLFSTSIGPAQVKSNQQSTRDGAKTLRNGNISDENDEGLDSSAGSESEDDAEQPSSPEAKGTKVQVDHEHSQNKKRKRRGEEDDVEGAYLKRLLRDEEKEDAKLRAERKEKRLKTESAAPDQEAREDETDEEDDGAVDEDEEEEDEENGFEIPQHETMTGSVDTEEMERAARTVFLGNVSTTAITSKSQKKELIRHLEALPENASKIDEPSKVESLRFRSTAFSTMVPKKAAFAKKDLMDATTKSTNAYAVYNTAAAAREATKHINGTVALGRHLRVDSVAHPTKVDHRRCVFVGNLAFVDDESVANANRAHEETRKVKKKVPADVEEGLWQQFGKVGKVESVRVVRDSKTRIGKGFAYVQFYDENAVEAALLLNEKKFPPMLPRKLRVIRAKKPARKNTVQGSAAPDRRGRSQKGVHTNSDTQTRSGRASKLLGRAGAAKSRNGSGNVFATGPNGNAIRAPEEFVFEGHRASNTQGKRSLGLGGPKKKKGKPHTRSAKRGSEWKRKGGEKTKK